jgi:hypothetical protein
MQLRHIILTSLAILLTGCWAIRDLKDYTFYGKTSKVDTRKLKITGAYYTIYKQGNADYVKCFLLYQDGTYHNLFSHIIDSRVESGLDIAIENILKYGKDYHEKYQRNIDMWGSFVIKSDTLHVQRFHSPASSEVFFTKVYDYKMRIVNDTTLFEIQTGYPSDRLEEYHFYETKNKPDSTNLFETNERFAKRLERLRSKDR